MFSIAGVEILGGTTNDYRVVEFCSDMVPLWNTGGTPAPNEAFGATLQRIHRIPIPRGLLLQPGWSLVVTQDGDNEVNTLTANATPGTGSFTLTVAGQVTAAIGGPITNATAAAVQAALEALSTVGVGGVRCEATTGANLGAANAVVTIRWMAFESADVAITIQTGGMTGNPVALATTTAGANAIVAGDTNVAVVTAQVLA